MTGIAWLLMGSLCAQTAVQRGVLENLDFVQRLGEAVPRDAAFLDADGNRVTLGQYLDRGPVLLNMVYYDCPMLCTLVQDGMTRALKPLGLSPGRDFQIVTISIDPAERPDQARGNRDRYLGRLGRADAAAGWHFLTGPEDSIAAVAEAVGFKYVRVPETGEYAHASGLVFLTATGTVSRYLFGVEFASRDVQLALLEAGQGRVGTPIERLLLYCYQYDPRTGGYGLVIMNVLRLCGGLTVGLLAWFIGHSLWRDRRRRRATASELEVLG